MILQKITLRNFRQFKGSQEIILSDNRKKNITLIHAENGFGKTTILNAILWALYGQSGLTEDFEGHNKLINNALAHKHKKNPTGIETEVALVFKHDDARYFLSRKMDLAEQNIHPQNRLSLEKISNIDGLTEQLDRPQQRIREIVPDGISKFLFFNGERVNELGLEKNSSVISDAIHQMLGLNLLKQTIEDLESQNVLGKFRKTLKENTSAKKRQLLEELEQLEKKQFIITNKIKINKAEIISIDEEIKLINSSLESNEAANKLQLKRQKLEEDKSNLRDEINTQSDELSALIAEDSYALFSNELLQKGSDIMTQLRKDNLIPAPVLDSFLKSLLDQKKCICSIKLTPGSKEYKVVAEHLSKAPNQDFNNAVGALDHTIGVIEESNKNTKENFERLSRSRLKLKKSIDLVVGEIEEINQKIGNKDNEAVRELEDSRKKKIIKRDEQFVIQGTLSRDLENCHDEIKSKKDQVAAIKDKEEIAALAQRRIEAIEQTSKVLKELLENETNEIRPHLNDKIKHHYSKIIDRNYESVLTEDFELKIQQTIGSGEDTVIEDVNSSTGQIQVKMLVFIASLIHLASERSKIPTILRGLSGSEYPLVADAPYGNISVFRKGICKWLPNLAPQVAIMLSPGQYEGDAEKTFTAEGRVGKNYYLAYHGPKNKLRENTQNFINVNGKKYQQYFEAAEEYTEVREIN